MARRLECSQAVQPTTQQLPGAYVVPPLGMVEAHAHLQYALVQIADGAPLSAPQRLERLVAFEKLAPVELANALDQAVGRWVVAAGRGIMHAST